MTLSEYIKNRRLSEANKALQSGARVTDVAYQYGYESLDGFTRAFKAFCGILPSEVAKTGLCRSFPPLSFSIDVKGGHSMHYKIVERPAFWLRG
jgi:AraC family transcriptional regulator